MKNQTKSEETEILIYQKNVIETYLHFIKENLNLIKKLTKDSKNTEEPYRRRAFHLQKMTLIGITAEHLIKIILLKRGFMLNVAIFGDKFDEGFMSKLRRTNNKDISQEGLNSLYEESTKNIELDFKPDLKKFDECIALFYKSNPKNYFDSLRCTLNLPPDTYFYEYVGKERVKELNPQNCLKVIQKMRNSYLHQAEAREETNGVIWYLVNFLIWICRREYPDFFVEEEYIGNQNIKTLFENGTAD